MTDRLIRITTALAVVAVAVVAAIISYQHAYELVRSHGESGMTARLLPFTVDGLIWAASMVVLDASRRNQARTTAGRVEPRRGRGAGIVATVGANLAHAVGHGPVGALVSAWPALALVGTFELLMMLIRTGRGIRPGEAEPEPWHQVVPPLVQEALPELTAAPTLEQTVRARRSDAGQMWIRFPRRRAENAGRVPDDRIARTPPDDRADWCRPRALGVRACCCPARPVVRFLSRPALLALKVLRP